MRILVHYTKLKLHRGICVKIGIYVQSTGGQKYHQVGDSAHPQLYKIGVSFLETLIFINVYIHDDCPFYFLSKVIVTVKGKPSPEMYSVSLTQLKPFTRYELRVRCMSESSLAGWSNWSDALIIQTWEAGMPTKYGNLKAMYRNTIYKTNKKKWIIIYFKGLFFRFTRKSNAVGCLMSDVSELLWLFFLVASSYFWVFFDWYREWAFKVVTSTYILKQIKVLTQNSRCNKAQKLQILGRRSWFFDVYISAV